MKKKYLALVLTAVMSLSGMGTTISVSANDVDIEMVEEESEESDDVQFETDLENEEDSENVEIDAKSEETDELFSAGAVEENQLTITSVKLTSINEKKIFYAGGIEKISIGPITWNVTYSNGENEENLYSEDLEWTTCKNQKLVLELVYKDQNNKTCDLSEVMDPETMGYNLGPGKYEIRVKGYEDSGCDFKVLSLTEDTNKKIAEGDNELDFAGQDTAYYWFQPESDGTYNIKADCDTWYISEQQSDGSYTDIEGAGLYNLSAGKKYALYCEKWEDDPDSFLIFIAKASNISSMKFEPAGIERDPIGIYVKGKMTWTYDDGEVLYSEVNREYDAGGYAFLFEPRYNISVATYFQAGNEEPKFFATYYPVGTQVKVYFECNGVKTDSCIMTIPEGLDTSRYPSLEEGINRVKLNIDTEWNWYKFIPRDTADYSICDTDESEDNIWIRAIDEQGRAVPYWSQDSYEWENKNVLVGGKTYLVGIRNSETIKISRNTLEGCKWSVSKNITPTCTTEGTKVETCATHKGETRTTVYPSLGGHKLNWITLRDATALEAGHRIQKCSVCGTIVAEQAIGKLTPKVKLNIEKGKTLPLKVKQSFVIKASDMEKGDRVVSWSSSNSKIASVSTSGRVVGKKAGTAQITVKLASGYSVQIKIKVQKSKVKTTSLRVCNKTTGKTISKKVSLKRKEKLNLNVIKAPLTSLEKVTYTSSNKKVAVISKNGVVTAKKRGNSVITVKSGKKYVKIKVSVK